MMNGQVREQRQHLRSSHLRPPLPQPQLQSNDALVAGDGQLRQWLVAAQQQQHCTRQQQRETGAAWLV